MFTLFIFLILIFNINNVSGQTCSSSNPSGISSNQLYYGVKTSRTGKYVIASQYNSPSYIYLSYNDGLSFTSVDPVSISSTTQKYTCVAMSNDGNLVLVVTTSGNRAIGRLTNGIYIWSSILTTNTAGWTIPVNSCDIGYSSSNDKYYIVYLADNWYYTSYDSGVTFTKCNAVGVLPFDSSTYHNIAFTISKDASTLAYMLNYGYDNYPWYATTNGLSNSCPTWSRSSFGCASAAASATDCNPYVNNIVLSYDGIYGLISYNSGKNMVYTINSGYTWTTGTAILAAGSTSVALSECRSLSTCYATYSIYSTTPFCFIKITSFTSANTVNCISASSISGVTSSTSWSTSYLSGDGSVYYAISSTGIMVKCSSLIVTDPPTGQPTSEPSIPTGRPTGQPSSQPTMLNNCMPGTYSVQVYFDSHSTVYCNPCPAGTYSSTTKYASGPTICAPCDAGKYSPGFSSSCSNCIAGYYSSSGQGTCNPCLAGTYSSNGASKCSTCPAGKYSPNFASSCISCDAGYYSNIGQKRCYICPSGTYSSSGSSSCLYCNSTSLYSSPGASNCDIC